MIINRLTKDPVGSIIFSIIMGLGLAALFRRACNGNDCVVIKSPSVGELDRYVYQIDQSCFKYTPHVVPCDRPLDAP